MLSHDNFYYVTNAGIDMMGKREGKDVIVSYLPLSHVVAQCFDVWNALLLLATVVFSDKMALRGSLLTTLKEARPTHFIGVPRVWEKIMEGIKEKGKHTKGLKKRLIDACKKAALEYNLHDKNSIMNELGQKIIYKKVRQAIGLDRCIGMYSGAAVNSEDNIKYFLSLDIVVCDLYGLTETTGPLSLQGGPGGVYGTKPKLGSVGKAVYGTMSRISNQDNDGIGEICMKGRNLMMGYLYCEDKTKDAFH